jgi:hypothetical protein
MPTSPKLFVNLLISFALVWAGCNTTKPVTYQEAAMRQGTPAASEQEGLPFAQKLVVTAYLDLEVVSPAHTGPQVDSIAQKYGGYVSEKGTFRATIRVQHEKLEAALSDIRGLGKVLHQNIITQDVTGEYTDHQIRLENAERSRERYLQLLAKAENVEAALQVEKELERLNGTIDLLKGHLNRLDHLTAFSTITLTWKEKKKPGLIGYAGLGLYHSVKWLFVRN